ncbi:MAG TPA: UDP-N-acetylmuramoyl-L-alanyl-D-glutamate--2,6-diaminopimelate ligase, partial [Micrococcales bacterium]
PRALAGELADTVYGRPSDDLVTVAVTGTNGKTTTAYFVDAALRAQHGSVALLGTVEVRLGDVAIESPRTTLEAPALHGVLAAAREQGVAALVTEASSQGIALHRLAGMRFDVVVFTNLQRDHLDYHGTMERYFAAKASIFSPERAARGVVLVDDEWGRRLAAASPIPVATLATHPDDDSAAATAADWRVVSADIGLDGVGSAFVLRGPDGTEHVAHSPLPGLVNVSNAAAAVVAAHEAGVPLAVAIDAVAAATAIPGRMERVVERGQGHALCIVDYAHTPDALVYALEAVRPITPGRLVLVFGSDGDRDQGKRPMLGEIAARLADVLVVTDENPRSEDPAAIRAAILDGVRTLRPDLTDVVEITTSRADALRHAVATTGEGDTVIVTGKGHEPTQEIAGVFHRYNDRFVYLEAVGDPRYRDGRPREVAAGATT